jgi:hypothetical protein
MTEIKWKVHEHHDPQDARIEDVGNYIYCWGKCKECHEEWCFMIANKAALEKMKEWNHDPTG